MIHEQAVREVHPEAKEFRPVVHFLRVTLGWTFQIPREGQESVDYGWVTADGEVSGDRLEDEEDAVRNLKAYLPVRKEMVKQKAKANQRNGS